MSGKGGAQGHLNRDLNGALEQAMQLPRASYAVTWQRERSMGKAVGGEGQELLCGFEQQQKGRFG